MQADNGSFAAELERFGPPAPINLSNPSPEKKRRQEELGYESNQESPKRSSGSIRSSATVGVVTPDSGIDTANTPSGSSEPVGSQEPELPPVEMMERGGSVPAVLEGFKSKVKGTETPTSDDDMPDIEHVEKTSG